MKRGILLIITMLYSFVGYGQNFEWVHNAGDGTNNYSYCTTTDAIGNSYYTGNFNDPDKTLEKVKQIKFQVDHSQDVK